MSTFAEDIEDAAKGETIEAIVLDRHDGYYSPKARFDAGNAAAGKVLIWSEARQLLDYEYDTGFGGADCHPITAWTATRVIFVQEYDGATNIGWLPRHPVEHVAEHSGKSGLLEEVAEAIAARQVQS